MPEQPDADADPPEEMAHDERGLDLARSIARGLAGRRPGSGRGRGRRRGGRAGDRGSAGGASGAHPDDRDPQTLDATLGRLVAEEGWTTDVQVHGVIGRWAQLVGPEVASHCTPESFDDGRLVVVTDSTAWATQLRLLTGTVLARLNDELGDGTVTFIEVRPPRGAGWTKGLRSVKGRGPRDTYG